MKKFTIEPFDSYFKKISQDPRGVELTLLSFAFTKEDTEANRKTAYANMIRFYKAKNELSPRSKHTPLDEIN